MGYGCWIMILKKRRHCDETPAFQDVEEAISCYTENCHHEISTVV